MGILGKQPFSENAKVDIPIIGFWQITGDLQNPHFIQSIVGTFTFITKMAIGS